MSEIVKCMCQDLQSKYSSFKIAKHIHNVFFFLSYTQMFIIFPSPNFWEAINYIHTHIYLNWDFCIRISTSTGHPYITYCHMNSELNTHNNVSHINLPHLQNIWINHINTVICCICSKTNYSSLQKKYPNKTNSDI